MFTGSIKISELDALSSIVAADFFPLVSSGSLTTYRVNITTLNNWFRVSGSCLSASWASASINATQAVSASWASASISAIRSISSSWASASISSSYALSASAGLMSVSSSFASTAVSASYAPFTQTVQVSSSWASASLSSSYALSASFAPAIGDTLPVGTIVAFPTSSAPNNFLECNGDAKLTASFSELYNAIKTSDLSASFGYLCDGFGNRDASGYYFKLPDLRGEFIRGWDHNRGVDTDRGFGSSQRGSVEKHKHIMAWGENGTTSATQAMFGYSSNTGWRGSGDTDGDNRLYFTDDGTNQAAGNTTAPNSDGVIGTETRPRNIAMMWCIKYSNAFNYANLVSSSLAGDVIGNTSATNVVAIQGVPVTSSVPTDGQLLQYDASAGKWKPASAQSNGLVAWATVLIPTASNYSSDNAATVSTGNSVNKPIILNSYNVSDVSWTARTMHVTSPWSYGKPDNGNTEKQSVNFLVTLTNAVSNLNYCVMGSWSECGAQPTDLSDEGVVHFNVLARRTDTQFTCSMNGGEFSGNPQACWLTFAVFA